MSFEVLIIKIYIMKHLIQITTVLFLLAQTLTYSQTKPVEPFTEKEDTTLKKEQTKTKFDTTKLQGFIGTYFLEEADFELEIIQEDNKMYLISPFSKDILIPKNETTLTEFTRGVDLELIENNKNALKFTQNGYETVIKRVKNNTGK